MEFIEGEDELLVTEVYDGEVSLVAGEGPEIATVVVVTKTNSYGCDCESCSWISPTNQDALVTFLSECSSMTKFAIYDGATSFPASLLTRIISQQQSRIKHVDVRTTDYANFGALDLVGTTNEFTELGSAVRTNLTSLESCSLELCATGGDSNSHVADGLFQSLLEVPTMTHLHLGSSPRSIPTVLYLEDMVSPSLLVQACLSTTLVTLRLRGIHEPIAISLLQVLETNECLEEFYVLCIDDWSITGAQAVGRLIRSNRTLKSLDLGTDLHSFYASEPILEMISALAVSTSIETFRIDTPLRLNVHSRTRKATNDMLQTNTVLEVLYLGWENDELDNNVGGCKVFYDEVQFYLNLNKAGRGALGSGPSKEQLVKSLEAVNDDVPCLFFFLSQYPSLCQLTDPTRVDSNNAENPRKRRRLYRAVKYNPVSYR